MNFDEGSEVSEMRKLLHREKQQRQYFEEKAKLLEAQLNPDRLARQLSAQVSKDASDDMVRTDAVLVVSLFGPVLSFKLTMYMYSIDFGCFLLAILMLQSMHRS